MSVTVGGKTLELHPSGPRAYKADDANAFIQAVADVVNAPPTDVGEARVTATGSTTARSVADRFSNPFNVLDFGAVGDGVTDDYDSVQAALIAACEAAGGTVYAPAGEYRLSKTLRINNSNVKFLGDGPGTEFKRLAGTLGPLLLVAPNPGPFPSAASLATGPGVSMDFPTTAPSYRYHLNISQGCAYKDNLNGQTAMTIRMFYKPGGTINSDRCILSAVFKRDSQTTQHESLYLGINSSGSVVFRADIAGVTKSVTTTAASVVSGSTYHLEVTYDNSKIRVFVNGVNKGETSATGAIVHPLTDEIRLGTYSTTYNENIGVLDGPMGKIDSLQIERGFAWHTANFTPPTAKHGFDFATCVLINFDDIQDDIFVNGHADIVNSTCAFIVQDYDYYATQTSGSGDNTEIAYMHFEDGGIRAIASVNQNYHDLDFLFCYAGAINANNNCYLSKFTNISTTSCTPVSLLNTGASGANVWRNLKTGGSTIYGLWANTSGIQIENAYLAATGFAMVLGNEFGGSMSAQLSFVNLTDENNANVAGLLLADQMVSLMVTGGAFEMLNGDSPPVRICGDTPATFIGTTFTKRSTVTELIKLATAGRTLPVQVIAPAEWALAASTGVPWSLTAGMVSVTDGGRVTAVQGISGTDTLANNLRGTVSVVDAATTGAVSFTTAEADASYYLTLTPSTVTGSPAAGANRVKSIAKLASGFTVTVETAPGAGTTQNYDWHLFR